MVRESMSEREDFEYWLAHMGDFLEELMADLPPQTGARLDYSPASLDVLESVILESYPSSKAAVDAQESRRVNRFACYVGETFRRALGGKWDIQLDEPSCAFFGMPILVFPGKGLDEECPLTLVTASTDRRTGKYLRGVLENLLAEGFRDE